MKINFRELAFILSGMATIGIAVGFMVGYFVNEFVTWKYIIYLATPILALGSILVIFGTVSKK